MVTVRTQQGGEAALGLWRSVIPPGPAPQEPQALRATQTSGEKWEAHTKGPTSFRMIIVIVYRFILLYSFQSSPHVCWLPDKTVHLPWLTEDLHSLLLFTDFLAIPPCLCWTSATDCLPLHSSSSCSWTPGWRQMARLLCTCPSLSSSYCTCATHPSARVSDPVSLRTASKFLHHSTLQPVTTYLVIDNFNCNWRVQ